MILSVCNTDIFGLIGSKFQQIWNIYMYRNCVKWKQCFVMSAFRLHLARYSLWRKVGNFLCALSTTEAWGHKHSLMKRYQGTFIVAIITKLWVVLDCYFYSYKCCVMFMTYIFLVREGRSQLRKWISVGLCEEVQKVVVDVSIAGGQDGYQSRQGEGSMECRSGKKTRSCTSHTGNWELSWCQLCCHWWHHRSQ